MAQLDEQFCMICGTIKNDPESITCKHPQCINTVLECIEDEKTFSSVVRNHDIKTPEDLKKHFNNVKNLKNDIWHMLKFLNVKRLKESLESALMVLGEKDLEKIISEINDDAESLD